MKILLDFTPLCTTSAQRGIGRYVRGLAQGLMSLPENETADMDLAGLWSNRSLLKLRANGLEMSQLVEEPGSPVRWDDARRALLISMRAASTARADGRWLHLTDPKGLPFSSAGGYSVTCHDLISLAMSDVYLPNVPGWKSAFRAHERRRYGRARRVLAVSEATRRDLERFLDVRSDKIDVVWHGIDHGRFNPRTEPVGDRAVTELLGERPYVLYLGAGDARKDLDTLVTAFATGKVRADADLVIAGALRPTRKASLRELANRMGVSGRVRLLGYVPESLVPSLYRKAWLHVFPSRYEGFGLPVLEALACGAPTLTSPGSSLDEVAGDAAVVVECGQPESLRLAMDRLAGDEGERQLLRERGFLRAARFTWEHCARETLEFWRRAAAGS